MKPEIKHRELTNVLGGNLPITASVTDRKYHEFMVAAPQKRIRIQIITVENCLIGGPSLERLLRTRRRTRYADANKYAVVC